MPPRERLLELMELPILVEPVLSPVLDDLRPEHQQVLQYDAARFVAQEREERGVGIGGFVVVIGLAFFVNSLFERRDPPPPPRPPFPGQPPSPSSPSAADQQPLPRS